MKYEVLTYTLCDGWVNCWSTTENGVDRPLTFDSIAEAQAEIDEMFEDIEAEIKAGERGEDEGYDRDDFVIVSEGSRYIEPALSTLMHLLHEGEKK